MASVENDPTATLMVPHKERSGWSLFDPKQHGENNAGRQKETYTNRHFHNTGHQQ